jgi:hypothetical protein
MITMVVTRISSSSTIYRLSSDQILENRSSDDTEVVLYMSHGTDVSLAQLESGNNR